MVGGTLDWEDTVIVTIGADELFFLGPCGCVFLGVEIADSRFGLQREGCRTCAPGLSESRANLGVIALYEYNATLRLDNTSWLW